jgi:adenylate kinase family enzyme
MMTLVADRLSRDDCVVRGWILDGFPHNHYQATALLDAGFEPDKLVVVDVDHETVFSRTRGRLIDPLTGKVYHKEFAPVDEHEEGKEVAARLTIRHDDANEDNVKNRLAKYDFSDAPVRSLFPTTAHFFDGAESIDEIYQKVEEFVTLEDREHDTRHITDARDLPLLEYEVLDACVYRRKCCVLVREPAFVNPDGRKPSVWVDIEDFAKTAEDFTNSFRPSADQFAHTHRDARLDKFDLGPGAKMIHVDSPEPTVLAFTLTVAPPEPPAPVPMPAPLVLCGPGVHTLATTLAARYPEIYEVASVEPKPEDPKPEGDGEAKDAAAEETPEGEEPAEPEAAETQADAEEEQAADADALPTEPYVPEKYPGAKSVKAIQSKGICAVVCLDPAGVVAFKAANAPPPPELDAEGNPIEEEPEVDADGNPIEKPEVPVPTLVCVGLPPMEPKQPRPPPKEVSEEAGEGEEEGEKEEEPLEDPKPKALTFDHVIYPNARSLDTPETTFEMLKGVFAVKVRLPAPPKDKVDTSTCEAVLHDYDWYKTGAPQRTVLTLATNTSQSATVHLPRGRHVLQLSVDPGFYFTADVRSQTAFDMDQPAKMLEEKQLAAPSLAEGTYPEMAAGDWHVWFRRVFKVDKPTTVSAALEVPDDAMSPFARFAVVDNDGAGEVTHFVAGAAPPKSFEPNTHGYTVMAYSKSLTPVPSGPWRLSALCDSPLASFDDQPVGEPTRFDGEYRPNYSHLVARVRLAIKNRSLLSIHFESDLPAGFTVTLTDPEDGWEEMQAEYLRGGHKGHLRGTELHRWVLTREQPILNPYTTHTQIPNYHPITNQSPLTSQVGRLHDAHGSRDVLRTHGGEQVPGAGGQAGQPAVRVRRATQRGYPERHALEAHGVRLGSRRGRMDRRHGSRKLFRPNALFVERGRLSQVQGDGSVRQARRGASREGVFRRGERAANPGVPRTLRRHRHARGRQGSSFTGGNRGPRRRRGRGGSRPAGHRARPTGAQARAPGYRRAQGDLHVGVRGA